MSSQSLDDLQKKLQPEIKTEELIDSAGMQLRVAVQHEKNKTGAAAELHDASDDVYYVLHGSATLVLGGCSSTITLTGRATATGEGFAGLYDPGPFGPGLGLGTGSLIENCSRGNDQRRYRR